MESNHFPQMVMILFKNMNAWGPAPRADVRRCHARCWRLSQRKGAKQNQAGGILTSNWADDVPPTWAPSPTELSRWQKLQYIQRGSVSFRQGLKTNGQSTEKLQSTCFASARPWVQIHHHLPLPYHENTPRVMVFFKVSSQPPKNS
jgi:hypothetical protein